MPTEHTSLKNTTPAGDSNTTNEMVVGKSKIYQRSFLIVAGSLLALLVLIAIAGTSGGQHLQSLSAHEFVKGAVALADYQLDSANLAHTKDIFGVNVAENNEFGKCCRSSTCACDYCSCTQYNICFFDKKRLLCMVVTLLLSYV